MNLRPMNNFIRDLDEKVWKLLCTNGPMARYEISETLNLSYNMTGNALSRLRIIHRVQLVRPRGNRRLKQQEYKWKARIKVGELNHET